MNADKIANATSIKSIIQELAPEQIRLMLGTVVSEGPLKVQALNDDKLTIPEDLLIVPQWLTDHIYPIYIETEWYEKPDPNMEELGPTFDDHCIYPCSGVPAPKHYYKTTKIKINNHLKTGDMVYMLAFSGGKKYLVIDRIKE